MVRGIPLQQSDFDGFVLVGVANASLLAQHLGGADTGTHAPQGVGFQNGARRAAGVVVGDATDKTRNVNSSGAGGLARRIEAVVAPVGLNLGLRQVERRVCIAKILRVLFRGQASGMNPEPHFVCLHGVVSNRFGGIKMACRCGGRKGALHLPVCLINLILQ
jgi:hypothetical protein